MKTYIKIFSVLAALTAAFSCSDWGTREVFEGSALGVVPDSLTSLKVFDLPATESQLHINVVSNQEYTISHEADWISAPATSRDKEGFDITCPVNDGVARSARIILAIKEAEHYDTLTVRQKGTVVPSIAFGSDSHTLKGSTGAKAEIPVSVNVPEDEIAFTLEYLSESTGWISGIAVSGDKLSFDYTANEGDTRRKARISASFTDGWGEVTTTLLYISQLNSSDSEGTPVDFSGLREMATEEGFAVDSDIIIEGIVVSDRKSGNAGDNPQTDEAAIDYSVSGRTIYLESTDARYGLCLETSSAEDNTFNQGDRIRLNISEAVLYKSVVTDADKDPVFYTLKGINYGMVLEHSKGSKADIPAKNRTIGTLTDDDIFTYVTLQDCELPVRKGSLTPLNEEFTEVFETEKCAKFPVLLRDIEGNSMYVYTNTTCPYRRDGSVLPYGSGTMSGVIVHEHYTRFEFQDTESPDEDTYGNIGRYQIRHTSKDDFGMADTMEDGSFSNILCEWRYALGQYQDKHDATDGDLAAYFTSSFKYDPDNDTYKKDGRAGKLAYTLYYDYSYLGPMDLSGNVNGLGVTLADGTYWMGPNFTGANSHSTSKINSKGNGQVPTEAGSAWCTNITRFNKSPQSMDIIFSTEGISTSQLSLQLAMMNDWQHASSKIPGPRYWHLEYSLTGKDGSWTRLETFSVPDYLQSNIPQIWQTAGFKQMNFPLPAAELCGKDQVHLRLIPDEGLAAGSRAMYLDPSSVTNLNGSYRTCWNYICVRYNK